MWLGGEIFSLMTSPLFFPTIRTTPPTIDCESNGAPGANVNRVTNRADRESAAKPVELRVFSFRSPIPAHQSHPSTPEAATLQEPSEVGGTWAFAKGPLSKANKQNIST